MKENRLVIRGEKQTNDEDKTSDVLYQGIAARTFERGFQLMTTIAILATHAVAYAQHWTFAAFRQRPWSA